MTLFINLPDEHETVGPWRYRRDAQRWYRPLRDGYFHHFVPETGYHAIYTTEGRLMYGWHR